MAILTLYNRHAAPWRGMYDGQEYVVDGHGKLSVLDYVARHLWNQSKVKWNPVTREASYCLAIVEEEPDVTDLDEIPLEVLDRSDLEPRYQNPTFVKGIRPVPPAHIPVTVQTGSS